MIARDEIDDRVMRPVDWLIAVATVVAIVGATWVVGALVP